MGNRTAIHIEMRYDLFCLVKRHPYSCECAINLVSDSRWAVVFVRFLPLLLPGSAYCHVAKYPPDCHMLKCCMD